MRVVTRTFAVVVVVVALLALWTSGKEVGAEEYVVPPATEVVEAPYAEWAHHHWVWLSSDQANQSSVLAFVEGFLSRNIPVGAVDLDSRWSSGINNFEFDTGRYPDGKGLIKELHGKNIKVIAWVTSVVDTDSSNYDEGKEKGYYLNDGRKLKWWHGEGSWLDYTNPAAVDWWHGQMDNLLDAGLDGWKCDGTDPYVIEFGIIHGAGGVITEREYADMYYGDFFNYTRKVRGSGGLIMSRPVDDLWSFSPRYTVFSGWVGDQDPTFKGLKAALWDMFHSAWRGYVGFGSDIGGYRCCGSTDKVNGRTTALFTRWFQMGAFCSLMENGGDNQHRPWKFGTGNATLDTYRVFVNIHYELVPYLLSTGTQAYYNGGSIMHPLSADLGPLPPTSWNYLLGDSIFVSPMVDNTTSTRVEFPDHADWIDWWDGTTHKGGSVADPFPVPFDKFPVFHKAGSILPLHVTNSLAGHGSQDNAGALTLFLPSPVLGTTLDASLVSVHAHETSEFGPRGRTLAYAFDKDGGPAVLRFQASAHPQPLAFTIRFVKENAIPFCAVEGVEVRRRRDDGTGLGWTRVDDQDVECGEGSGMGEGVWDLRIASQVVKAGLDMRIRFTE